MTSAIAAAPQRMKKQMATDAEERGADTAAGDSRDCVNEMNEAVRDFCSYFATVSQTRACDVGIESDRKYENQKVMPFDTRQRTIEV